MDDAGLLNRYPVLRFFTYAHLPENLASISADFHRMAWDLAERLPYDNETSAGLRKLLEAKDCMVRAAVSGEA